MDADGRPLQTGQHGEIVIQGPNVIQGYENNPEANASSFANGWFRTGDQDSVDADGYLTLVAASRSSSIGAVKKSLRAKSTRC